jgi:hypothetical protein
MIARIPSEYSEAMSFENSEVLLIELRFLCGQISKLSTLPSYGLRCYIAPVCSLLMDGSENP